VFDFLPAPLERRTGTSHAVVWCVVAAPRSGPAAADRWCDLRPSQADIRFLVGWRPPELASQR